MQNLHCSIGQFAWDWHLIFFFSWGSYFLKAINLKELFKYSMFFFWFFLIFFDFFCWQKKLGKGMNLGPLGWREDSNHYITCFFFETIVCKKDIYNINHCVNIIKIFWFFSCWELYYKCIKLGVVFNFLLLFSVCPHLILTQGHDFPSLPLLQSNVPLVHTSKHVACH